MSRTLTALFDNRADAEAAKQRLDAAKIDVSHVHIHDRESDGYSATDYSSDHDQGFWKKLKQMALPEEDRHTYEEGVRRGGVVLTAEVDADQADEAARVLEQQSVDLDQRSGEWRKAGWDYKPKTAATATAATAATAARTQDKHENEQRIPIAEERLAVGKREVDRGSVRVRSYVAETPVHEEVKLRDERVSVDRRPVDRAIGAGENPFKERTVEMTARGEEAVVSKQAQVREELVIRKDATERTDRIDDTVRHTEVEIDRDRGTDRLPGDRKGF